MPPAVSIIVPCYNEVHRIRGLLDAIRRQTYPTDNLEVIIADGGSSDGTRELIDAFATEHPDLRIKVVDNPRRIIPAALNLAIRVSDGEIVVRLDAHSEPIVDYIERCIESLKRTQAANVGGQWEIRPGRDSWIGHSIAAAAAHPVGAGDARYRTGGAEGEVDTIPFGAFSREWLEKVGQFNEKLLTNEDYEYNARIRAAGGVVWFDPTIRSVYYARSTLRELWGQYARYGFWKARMLRSFPETLRWRQALPPLSVLTTLALTVVAPFSFAARLVLSVGWSLYGLTLLVVGVWTALKRGHATYAIGMPLALLTMHLSWGLGAVWGLIISLFTSPDPAY